MRLNGRKIGHNAMKYRIYLEMISLLFQNYYLYVINSRICFFIEINSDCEVCVYCVQNNPLSAPVDPRGLKIAATIILTLYAGSERGHQIEFGGGGYGL